MLCSEFKKLKKRYALNSEIDKETYKELKQDMESQIAQLSSKNDSSENKISNLDNYLPISEHVVKNISKYWASEGLETKKRIQDLVFPDGLLLDTKRRAYLTSKVNLIFQQSSILARVSEDAKKNDTSKNLVSSFIVPCRGIGSNTL